MEDEKFKQQYNLAMIKWELVAGGYQSWVDAKRDGIQKE